MKLLSFSSKSSEKIVLCVGYFETFHSGHIKLIKLAKATNYKVAILFFNSNPLSIIISKDVKEFFNCSERIDILNKLNIDYAWNINFNNKIKNYSVNDFHECIKKSFPRLQCILSGKDFSYARNKSGNVSTLKKEFNVQTLNYYLYRNKKLSSTIIKKLFMDNKFSKINSLLNYSYYFSGKVVHGFKWASKFGIPTANIKLNQKNKILPGSGIYVAKCIDSENRMYRGALCINTDNDKKIEIHILDFKRDIYGENIKIIPIFFIRKYKTFKYKNNLIKRIRKDISFVQDFDNYFDIKY